MFAAYVLLFTKAEYGSSFSGKIPAGMVVCWGKKLVFESLPMGCSFMNTHTHTLTHTTEYYLAFKE